MTPDEIRRKTATGEITRTEAKMLLDKYYPTVVTLTWWQRVRRWFRERRRRR